MPPRVQTPAAHQIPGSHPGARPRQSQGDMGTLTEAADRLRRGAIDDQETAELRKLRPTERHHKVAAGQNQKKARRVNHRVAPLCGVVRRSTAGCASAAGRLAADAPG